jgi:hypothetical protein
MFKNIMIIISQKMIIIIGTAVETSNLTFKNIVPTSQETHCPSITKPSRLMLFRETAAVYCENYTEHINTLCGQTT